jgi:aldehyde dehydrogenase (NAD+)/betaine-aldehyde dehydrogenase
MVPFGGYGMSGLGREAGAEAIRDYSRAKTILLNTPDARIGAPFVMR